MRDWLSRRRRGWNLQRVVGKREYKRLGERGRRMSEMLAKSFEMTASKEVQNALKVEKVIAAKKLAIHTKDMDLPPPIFFVAVRYA